MNMYMMKYGKWLQVALCAIAMLGLAVIHAMPDLSDPGLGIEIDRIMTEQERDRDRQGYDNVNAGSTEPRDIEGWSKEIW